MSHTSRRAFLRTLAGGAAASAITPRFLWAAPPLRLEEPLTAAVLGAGRQGRAILSELSKIDGLQIVAVCDPKESRRRSGLRRARGAEGFSDHRAALDKKPDLAFVATPSHLHKTVAGDALAADCHVYCEAPLATTVADCQALASAARESTRVFHTGMLGRTNPIYKLARSFVRGGAIRDITGLRAQHNRKTSWRAPANTPAEEAALNWRLDPTVSIGLEGEWGTHQFDVAHWFLGAYPTAVSGNGSIQMHRDGREVFDTVTLELAFPGERRLTYGATLANSFEDTYELFQGTMGTVKLAHTAGWLFKEADAATQGWEVYANRQHFHNEAGITLIADATKLAAQDKLKDGVGLPSPPLFYGLESFLKSVSEDAPVTCSADEGLRAAVVGIKAHEAVTSGTTVAIDPDLLKSRG